MTLHPELKALQSKPLVEVTRGDLTESLHRGYIDVSDADGAVIASVGDINAPTYFRSAAKPFQTIPIISSGAADQFNFIARELAVITGSHSGEAIHLETVLSILGKTGLTPAALLCGAHLPFDEATAKRMRAEKAHPDALHNNCSGKHAGMLALARFLNEPVENYIDPGHPIQIRIRRILAKFAGVQFNEIVVAIDGCSAPVFGMPIRSMAQSYARLIAPSFTGIDAELKAAAEKVVSAMIEFPEMIGGSHDRLDTDLMRVARGQIISKVGAEGVQLLGIKPHSSYPKGLGIAIKIEDGDIRRARDPVVIETLRQLGLLDDEQTGQLAKYSRAKIYNHRKIEVGEVRTCFKLF
jgi:L-asparaginase II